MSNVPYQNRVTRTSQRDEPGYSYQSSQGGSSEESYLRSEEIRLKVVKGSRPRILHALILCLLIVIVVLSVILALEVDKRPAPAPSPLPPVSPCKRQAAISTQAMVSTTHYHATDAGLAILKAGGNAADAAAAIQFMLAVVQPQSTGIGGGCFVLYRNSSGYIFALDGREEAPARFNATSFCKNPDCLVNPDCVCDEAWPFGDRETGGHAVGVPGVMSAMARLRDDHGTMDFSKTMAPAIARAKEGFVMYEELYSRLMTNRARLLLFPASKSLYLPIIDGNESMPVPVGGVMKNPDLAETLELLAEQGEAAFYTGVLAKEILETVQNARNPTTGLVGVMQESDLKNYSAVYRKVIQSSYHNYTVYGFPPPSGGGLSLALMLNMLEPMKVHESAYMGTDYVHRLLDVQNLAFADRNTWLADSDFYPVPNEGFLDKSYAHARVNEYMRPLTSAQAAYSASLNSTKILPLPPGPLLPTQPGISIATDRHGTTHLVVMDSHHNVISMTTTIEDNMGSAVVVPNRGFLLNNELTDFTDLPADPITKLPYANAPSGERRERVTALGPDSITWGGKRPLSSMTPTILLGANGELIGIGSPGGSRIIGTVLNGVLPLADYEGCVADATDVPRGIGRNRDSTELEVQFIKQYPDVFADLKDRGFNLTILADNFPLGFLEAVRSKPGKGFEGAADIRNGAGSAKGI